MKMKDFGFYRGVDLGGWFSQCDYSEDRLENIIKEKDFGIISGWGLDHVRIPVDYNVMEAEDGKWKEDGFKRIGNADAVVADRDRNARHMFLVGLRLADQNADLSVLLRIFDRIGHKVVQDLAKYIRIKVELLMLQFK